MNKSPRLTTSVRAHEVDPLLSCSDEVLNLGEVSDGLNSTGATVAELKVVDSRHQAAMVSTGDLLFSCLNAFEMGISCALERIEVLESGQSLLFKLIDKGQFTSPDSVMKILLTPMAMRIMFILWRESGEISDEAILISGVGRPFAENGKHLTKNSLRNAICDDLGVVDAAVADALKRSVDRVCDALEIMGLLEKQEVRPNLKPCCGTPLLHSLLTEAFEDVYVIFEAQLRRMGETGDA